MTPTARTLDALRRDGFTPDVVERWIPGANIRRDLFGIIDIVAVKAGAPGVLGIQCTSGSNVSARLHKARAEPRLAVWLASGNRFQVWGWEERNGRWHVRKVALTGADLAEVPLTVLPRRRRKGKGERQLELFAG